MTKETQIWRSTGNKTNESAPNMGRGGGTVCFDFLVKLVVFGILEYYWSRVFEMSSGISFLLGSGSFFWGISCTWSGGGLFLLI